MEYTDIIMEIQQEMSLAPTEAEKNKILAARLEDIVDWNSHAIKMNFKVLQGRLMSIIYTTFNNKEKIDVIFEKICNCSDKAIKTLLIKLLFKLEHNSNYWKQLIEMGHIANTSEADFINALNELKDDQKSMTKYIKTHIRIPKTLLKANKNIVRIKAPKHKKVANDIKVSVCDNESSDTHEDDEQTLTYEFVEGETMRLIDTIKTEFNYINMKIDEILLDIEKYNNSINSSRDKTWGNSNRARGLTKCQKNRLKKKAINLKRKIACDKSDE